MPAPFVAIVGAGAVAGAIHLGAYYGGRPRLAGLAKGVPIVLLLGWVLACEPAVGAAYRRLVAAGLVFSLGGDLLLLSRARFRAGLGSFFIGHVCYTLAFAMASTEVVASPLALVALAGGGAGVLRVLWSHLTEERIPVICYVVMIAVMAWTAIGRASGASTPQPSCGLAALGAVIFMASDTTLALDRFVNPWHGAHAAVMVTYYAAQILIAASVAA